MPTALGKDLLIVQKEFDGFDGTRELVVQPCRGGIRPVCPQCEKLSIISLFKHSECPVCEPHCIGPTRRRTAGMGR